MSEELNNMQEFAIEETQEEKNEVIDPIQELVDHDFSSDKEINLDESYEMINLIERENQSAKGLEAENIIEDISSVYIDEEYKVKLDKSIENVKSFIKKYNIELEEVKNLSESEKTKIYGIGSFLEKNVGKLLNDLEFGITLSRDEYKFIQSAVERKISYDGNDVFNIIELNERYLKEWKSLDKSLAKTVPTMLVNIDIKNVVMLYHFLNKHTVKGLDKEFYLFSAVLHKIADTNRIFNAYNVIKERLDADFNIWVSAIDESELVENTENESLNGSVD